MIELDVKQGTPAWVRARLAIPTASSFSKIITRLGEPSKQATQYMRNLLAEYVIGEPCDDSKSAFMDRGKHLEAEARKWYQWEREVEVREVGFVLRDDLLVGASPDGFIGEDGQLEIKCNGAPVHVDYLLNGGVAGEHWQQCQGNLYVSGRKWIDLVAYNPVLPKMVHRYTRDEPYMAKLDAAINAFVAVMLRERKKLEQLGCRPAGKVAQVIGENSDHVPF